MTIDGFQFGAIRNRASVDILVCVSLSLNTYPDLGHRLCICSGLLDIIEVNIPICISTNSAYGSPGVGR